MMITIESSNTSNYTPSRLVTTAYHHLSKTLVIKDVRMVTPISKKERKTKREERKKRSKHQITESLPLVSLSKAGDLRNKKTIKPQIPFFWQIHLLKTTSHAEKEGLGTWMGQRQKKWSEGVVVNL